MDSLGKLFEKRFKKTAMIRQVEASLVLEFTNSQIRMLWGEAMAKKVKAGSLKKGILTINCSDSIMAQEVRFKERLLLNQANRKFGKETVEKLKIVQKGVERE